MWMREMVLQRSDHAMDEVVIIEVRAKPWGSPMPSSKGEVGIFLGIVSFQLTGEFGCQQKRSLPNSELTIWSLERTMQ